MAPSLEIIFLNGYFNGSKINFSMFDFNDWHFSQYMPRGERVNRIKGFLSLMLITFMIVCGVALMVYVLYIYRVHPELLFGEEEPSTQFLGTIGSTLFC